MGKYKVDGDKAQNTETGEWFELDSFPYGYWNGCNECGAYGDLSAEAGDLEGDELIESQLNNLIIVHDGDKSGFFCKDCSKEVKCLIDERVALEKRFEEQEIELAALEKRFEEQEIELAALEKENWKKSIKLFKLRAVYAWKKTICLFTR